LEVPNNIAIFAPKICGMPQKIGVDLCFSQGVNILTCLLKAKVMTLCEKRMKMEWLQ